MICYLKGNMLAQTDTKITKQTSFVRTIDLFQAENWISNHFLDAWDVLRDPQWLK